jgi:protein-tyrosine phosphatase
MSGGGSPAPMPTAGFVDCHSHVCPSGDDGASTVPEGAVLCREAARRGTAVLFATPHVWPHLPLTAEREREIRSAFAELRPAAGLELRLGFELTPHRRLLADDPRRYALEGTDCVLMEVPFSGPVDVLVELAEHAELEGLRPVIAHPERTESVLAEPAIARDLAARDWALQVNGSSLLGRHGEASAEAGWELVESGLAALVASDGHRPTRPPHLDEAWRLVSERLGPERARPLFDGSALGVRPLQRERTA